MANPAIGIMVRGIGATPQDSILEQPVGAQETYVFAASGSAITKEDASAPKMGEGDITNLSGDIEDCVLRDDGSPGPKESDIESDSSDQPGQGTYAEYEFFAPDAEG